eukprot:m.226418 g.226418  ORF g.226418 m.226418 type:complete len:1450 (+) comp11421_c0_seq1:361-4710(+)
MQLARLSALLPCQARATAETANIPFWEQLVILSHANAIIAFCTYRGTPPMAEPLPADPPPEAPAAPAAAPAPVNEAQQQPRSRTRSFRDESGKHYYTSTREAQALKVEEQPWFRPTLTRADSDQYLLKTPPGAFVVRKSPDSKSFVMDVQAGPRVGHVLLSKVEFKGHEFYNLPGTTHAFEHIYDLILFCHYNAFNFKNINESSVSITLSLAMSKRAQQINERRERKKEEAAAAAASGDSPDGKGKKKSKEPTKPDNAPDASPAPESAPGEAAAASGPAVDEEDLDDERTKELLAAEVAAERAAIEAKAAADAQARREAEAAERERERQEAAARAFQEEEEEKERQEEEERLARERAEKARQEEERRRREEERRRQEEERRRQEEEERRREEEERRREEEEERRRQEEEAAERRREAARRAAEEAARQEEEERERRAAEKARVEAERVEREAQAKREAAERAAQAKRELEEREARLAEERARREEETRRIAEERERRLAEERARREAEEAAIAEERAQQAAEAQARREAEQAAVKEAMERARRENLEREQRETEMRSRQAAEAQARTKKEREDRSEQEAQRRLAQANQREAQLNLIEERRRKRAMFHPEDMFSDVAVKVHLIPGVGQEVPAAVTASIQGHFKPENTSIPVSMLLYVDSGAHMEDSIPAMQQAAAKLARLADVSHHGAELRVFGFSGSCQEIVLRDTYDYDKALHAISESLVHNDEAANYPAACQHMAATLKDALTAARNQGTPQPRRIEVVFVVGGSGASPSADFFAAIQGMVKEMEAVGLFVRVTAVPCFSNPADVLCTQLARVTCLQNETEMLFIHEADHVVPQLTQLGERYFEASCKLSLTLLPNADLEPVSVDYFQPINAKGTTSDIDVEFTRTLPRGDAGAWDEEMQTYDDFFLLCNGMRVKGVAFTSRDDKGTLREVFYSRMQILYDEIHTWAMDPVPARSRVAALIQLYQHFQASLTAARAAVDWDARDEEENETQLFYFDWLKQRMGIVMDLAQSGMLAEPSKARMKLLEMSSRTETRLDVMFNAAQAEHDQSEELRARLKRWEAARYQKPKQKLAAMMRRDDGTFVLAAPGEDDVKVGPQKWLRSRTSLPAISAYHPVLQVERGHSTTSDLAAFSQDLRRLQAESSEIDTHAHDHPRIYWPHGQSSGETSPTKSAPVFSFGGNSTANNGAVNAKLNIFYPSPGGVSSETDDTPVKPKKKSFFSFGSPSKSDKSAEPANPTSPTKTTVASPTKAAASAPAKTFVSPTKNIVLPDAVPSDAERKPRASAPALPTSPTKRPSAMDIFASASPAASQKGSSASVISHSSIRDKRSSFDGSKPAEEAPPKDKESKPKKGLRGMITNSFNTLARRKLKKREPIRFSDVEQTRNFPADSEFFSVHRGETLAVLQELPDGTIVVRRDTTGEEGLVPASVFEKDEDDDLASVAESNLFD